MKVSKVNAYARPSKPTMQRSSVPRVTQMEYEDERMSENNGTGSWFLPRLVSWAFKGQ